VTARADIKIAAALFLTLAGLYGLAAPGHFYLLDASFKLTWAENAIHRGQLHFDHDQIGKESRVGSYFYPGRNGELYIHFPLGGLFCFVPPVLAAAAATKVVPALAAVPLSYTLASLNNIPWSAAAAVLVFLLARHLGLARRRALAGALVFGLATPVFAYATFDFNEPVAGFFTLLAVALTVVGWRRRRRGFVGYALGAGAALGFAFTIRYELLAFAATAVVLWLALALWGKGRVWGAALFALGFVAVAAVVPLYNWYARGSAGDFAYNTLPFFTNLIAARFTPLESGGPLLFGAKFVWVYFLSPNMHNVIIYCPLAAFGVVAAAALARAYGARVLFLVVPPLALAGAVLFTTYSSWAWGLRYAYLFWMILSAAAVLAPWRRRAVKVTVAAFAVAGVLLNVAAVAADYQLTQNDIAAAILGDRSQVNYRRWLPEGRVNPRYAQIPAQFKYAGLAVARTFDYYVHRGELRWLDRPPPGLKGDERALLDIWPVFAQLRGGAPAATAWAPYLLLVIATAAAARWLRRLARATA